MSFSRYARLLLQLPVESRFVRKYNPLQDWDWDKEVQSQILRELDEISCQLSNMCKKKGAKKAKPQEQLQPDYVKKAKAKIKEDEKSKNEYSEGDIQAIEDFWKSRNPNATFLGDKK